MLTWAEGLDLFGTADDRAAIKPEDWLLSAQVRIDP